MQHKCVFYVLQMRQKWTLEMCIPRKSILRAQQKSLLLQRSAADVGKCRLERIQWLLEAEYAGMQRV